MPGPRRSRVRDLALLGVTSAALGTIPLHRAPRPVRLALVWGPAAVAAGGAVLAVRGREDPLRTRPVRAISVIAPVVLGGMVAAAGAGGILLDRSLERALRRHGAPAPRVLLGLASGAVMVAVRVLEERSDAREAGDGLEQEVLALLSAADPSALAPGTEDGTPADAYLFEAGAVASHLREEGGITAAELDGIWEQWFAAPAAEVLGAEGTAELAARLSALVAEPAAA